MAGETSSYNFRDTNKGNPISFSSAYKAIARKQFIDISKVHIEKSISCSFYYTFCRAGQNCVGQIEIKVHLPYLESVFKS